MNTTLSEGVQLAKSVRQSIEDKELNCEVV